MNLDLNKHLLTFTAVMFIAVKFKTNCAYTPMSRIVADTTKMIYQKGNVYNILVFQVILSSTDHISKSLDYNLFHPWLGTGLLTSAGK
jgi:hypothetical protein